MTLVWTTGVGLAGLLTAYLEISATVVLSRQLAWLAVSIAMVAISGLGNAFFLTEGARRTRARIRRLTAGTNLADGGSSSVASTTWIELLEETRHRHRRRL